jgi:hypothetical protein
MKHIFRFSVLVLFSLLLLSCDGDGENLDSGIPLSFSISVEDTFGNPVSDYEVSVWNNFSTSGGGANRPLTTFGFSVEQESNISIKTYDLDNNLVNTLHDEVRAPGNYGIDFTSTTYDSGEPIRGGCVVLRYEMTAIDSETREILFEDAEFMCRFEMHLGNSIGLLDSDGLFGTDNKLYFPHLYNLPEMRGTDEDGNNTGNFTLPDEVVITIYDSENDIYQTYERVVEQGENNFDLVWDNSKSQKAEQTEYKSTLKLPQAEEQKIVHRNPHPVYIEVWDCDGIQIPFGDVHYEAVITERPDEIIEINNFGWEYGGVIPGYISGNLENGFSSWIPGETLEITLEQISTGYTVTNSWILTSAGYEYFPNPGGLELLNGSECWFGEDFIDWGDGVTGNVTGGIPSNPGYGYGTGLPNEDLLEEPENIGYYFTLSIDDDEYADITLCIDQIAFGYVPFNLAYWSNGEWIYEPEDGSYISWANPGTSNSCVTFNIDSTLREDVPIVLTRGPNDDAVDVELTNFVAYSNYGEEYITISWTTESEEEMNYYRVYRDGIEITVIEALNEPSTHEYQVTDAPNYEGTYYYTLEAVAVDGASSFWGPTPVEFYPVFNYEWRLSPNYPNPFN